MRNVIASNTPGKTIASLLVLFLRFPVFSLPAIFGP